jgi:hypothetical protein
MFCKHADLLWTKLMKLGKITVAVCAVGMKFAFWNPVSSKSWQTDECQRETSINVNVTETVNWKRKLEELINLTVYIYFLKDKKLATVRIMTKYLLPVETTFDHILCLIEFYHQNRNFIYVRICFLVWHIINTINEYKCGQMYISLSDPTKDDYHVIKRTFSYQS